MSPALEGDCCGVEEVREPGLRQNARNVACSPEHWTPATTERYHLRICRVMAEGQSYRMSDISDSDSKCKVAPNEWRCLKECHSESSALKRLCCLFICNAANEIKLLIFIIRDNTTNQQINITCAIECRFLVNSMLRHHHMFSGYSNVRRDYSGLWHEAYGLWFYTSAIYCGHCDSVTHILEYDTSPKVNVKRNPSWWNFDL